MSGIVEKLLSVAGFSRPSKAVPQRRRAAQPRRRASPAASERRPRDADKFAEGFGSAAPATLAPSKVPAFSPAAYAPRRTRRFNGFGMVAMASILLAAGGWMGSQVQAYALGSMHQAETVDPTEMRPVEGTPFTF